MMSIELFENAIAQVAPITEQVCFHLMGDPLVHPRLSEFVEICQKYQAPINLVTNGVLLNEKNSTLLLNTAFRQVNFSLHSFESNFPQKDPSTYLNKIFEFTERALTHRPDLFINYRLWDLGSVHAASSSHCTIHKKIEERFRFELRPATDIRQNKSVNIKGRLFMHYETEFVWPNVDLPFLGERGTCHGLRAHFGILVDGTVVPCCLDKEGKIPLGNIQSDSLPSILRAPRAQAILRGFHQGKLIEPLCQRCQYIERFLPKLSTEQIRG